MRTTLIAALLLLTATPALAEADWVEVAQNAAGTSTSYVDNSTITITGPIHRYWVRRDFKDNPDGWTQVKVLQEDNCDTGQTRVIQFLIYYANGKNHGVTASDQSWEYVAPDTIGSAIHDYVCRR